MEKRSRLALAVLTSLVAMAEAPAMAHRREEARAAVTRSVTRPAGARPGDKRFHPLLVAVLINRARGQDARTALRNAVVGHVVGAATGGIPHPVARAIVSTELTSRINTGQPAGAQARRDAAEGAILGEIVGDATASIADPVTRAVVSTELTSLARTGKPAGRQGLRNAAVGAAIRQAANRGSSAK